MSIRFYFMQMKEENKEANKNDASQSIDNINPQHYQLAIQPIDYIVKNNLDFLEGNVIKYVSRYKQKNGLEDLLKAKKYLELLIERQNEISQNKKATD